MYREGNLKKKPTILMKTDERMGRIFAERPRLTKKIEHGGAEPVFDRGNLDHVLFRSVRDDHVEVKVLRLFRVKSVSNRIRVHTDNEENFKKMLNKFGDSSVSFVVLYASKPGEEVYITYGVLMEGSEAELPHMVERTKYYIGSMEDRFRSNESYRNAEILPLRDQDDWIFTECLTTFNKLSLVRGIPKPDPATGIRVGSSPYGGNPSPSGAQVGETFLKGVTAKVEDGKAVGTPFVMCIVLRPIDVAEIQRVLFKTENMLSRLSSAREISVSENENFSFPFLFGLGIDNMFGQNQQQALGMSESDGMAKGVTDTRSEGSGSSSQSGETIGTTSGETRQVGTNEAQTDSAGHNGGVSYIGSYTESASGSLQQGINKSFGENQSISEQNSFSETNSTQRSVSMAESETMTNTNGRSISQTEGASESQGKNTSLAGGMSAGDGSSLTRRQVDQFYDTAIDIYEKYRKRTEASLRSGMYDMTMFVLTPDEESKIRVDELIKQSYIDDGAPLPARVEQLPAEEEKVLLNYYKSFSKPDTKEHRTALPEHFRYSTYITPHEATAFSLPQVNLEGYNSSFDPIPESIHLPGKMEQGISIGQQIHPHFNVLSEHSYEITKERLTHIGIYGITGVGKTVFTQRFASELHNKFDMNVMVWDWTRNHRSLIGHVKDPSHFRFYSFNPDLEPLRINLLRAPKGVPDHVWVPTIAELFCYTMGLGSRSFQIIIDILEDLIAEGRRTGDEPTMRTLVEAVDREFNQRMAASQGKMDFNERSTFMSMRDRLKRWMKPGHPVFECMCGGNFVNIEDLVRGNFVQLIECNYLPEELKQFVINGATAGIFYHSKFYKKLKKPVYIIFEEAHAVLQGPTGNEALAPGETIFETINREARNYNLFIGYICQSPELLPEKIFDCTPLRVVFQIPDDKGKEKIISAGGRDPMRLDIDLKNWLSRQPVGTCLIRGSIFHQLQENEFVAVKVRMLPTDDLEDDYFKKLYRKKQYT